MIKIHNPNNLPTKKISDLKPLQGNLKILSSENYQKLKNSLTKHGFIAPIFTWESYILDGHGRQRVMLQEGWDLEVPIVNIDAASEQDAKEKLLKITSQYQTVTLDGLDEFLPDWQELDLNFDKISFLEIDTDANKSEKKEKSFDDTDNTVICPKCSYEFQK